MLFKVLCSLDPSKQLNIYIFLHCPIMHWHVPLLCVKQKHAAALSVPGAPSVSRISVSAHSVQAKQSPQCVAVTAPPTITCVNLACPPACRRGELMWWSLVIVMKVGNGLWNGVIMLTNRPLKWYNYLYQLTCGTVFSHLWIFIMVAPPVAPTAACQWANRAKDEMKVIVHVHKQNLLQE